MIQMVFMGGLPLKSSAIANLALMLVLLGWLMMACGYLASIHDFTSSTPGDWQAAYYARATLIMGIGLAVSTFSVWLSGLAFHAAKRRAIGVVVLFFIPLAAIVLMISRNVI